MTLPTVIGPRLRLHASLITCSKCIERMMKIAATYRKPTCARTLKDVCRK